MTNNSHSGAQAMNTDEYRISIDGDLLKLIRMTIEAKKAWIESQKTEDSQLRDSATQSLGLHCEELGYKILKMFEELPE